MPPDPDPDVLTKKQIEAAAKLAFFTTPFVKRSIMIDGKKYYVWDRFVPSSPQEGESA